MSNGPKAFFNQTDLKPVQNTRYLGHKTFRLESSRSVYTASSGFRSLDSGQYRLFTLYRQSISSVVTVFVTHELFNHNHIHYSSVQSCAQLEGGHATPF